MSKIQRPYRIVHQTIIPNVCIYSFTTLEHHFRSKYYGKKSEFNISRIE